MSGKTPQGFAGLKTWVTSTEERSGSGGEPTRRALHTQLPKASPPRPRSNGARPGDGASGWGYAIGLGILLVVIGSGLVHCQNEKRREAQTETSATKLRVAPARDGPTYARPFTSSSRLSVEQAKWCEGVVIGLEARGAREPSTQAQVDEYNRDVDTYNRHCARKAVSQRASEAAKRDALLWEGWWRQNHQKVLRGTHR